MDDRERDKFYRSSPPQGQIPTSAANEDDGEYELEEPDTEAEARRQKAILAARPPAIDVDALYREADRDYGGEILESWVRGFRFRIEHLMMAPAVLVIAVAL